MKKIAVVSFDYFSYDSFIVKALNEKEGIDAKHIDFSKIKYEYQSFLERGKNFYLKNFQNRNIKKEFIEEQILKQLGDENYDQILVMRPDRISMDTLRKVKVKTSSLLCYLYDSSSRMDIGPYIKNGIFDKAFTFDKNDSEKFNIPLISNYVHWDYEPANTAPVNDLFNISSADDRLKILNIIAEFAQENNLKTDLNVIGKLKGKSKHQLIKNSREVKSLEEVKNEMRNSFAVVDLVRKEQKGLSFRPFEAMALEKKLITDNELIKEYDFYNPSNIYVIEDGKVDPPNEFFTTPYEKIPDSIYNQYKVGTWVQKVFD